MVYIRCRQEFRHYDSYGSSNKEIAKQLAYKIQPFVHGKIILILYLLISKIVLNKSRSACITVIL